MANPNADLQDKLDELERELEVSLDPAPSSAFQRGSTKPPRHLLVELQDGWLAAQVQHRYVHGGFKELLLTLP